MPKSIRKTVIISAFFAAVMFGFSFAMSPLYRVVCKVTGLNGAINTYTTPDMSKTITIQFLANNNSDLPWEFHPEKNTLIVHPDETATMQFFAKNNSNHTMVVQAVPSFAPTLAARYFHKIECFCFRQQTLEAGEAKYMPVVFRVDKALPNDVRVITLSYTLFDVSRISQ